MGEQRTPSHIDIWPEHHETWRVWSAVGNAWSVVAGMGGMAYLGFDRAQAESVMRTMGVKKSKRRRLLDDLLVMESAALPILNAK